MRTTNVSRLRCVHIFNLVFSMLSLRTEAWSQLPSSRVSRRQLHRHASVRLNGFVSLPDKRSIHKNSSRRSWMQGAMLTLAGGGAMIGRPSAGSAIDMDAFALQQLSDDTNKKQISVALTDDEALCKYGQPSPKKGDACVRAGLPTTAAKKGGVDAYGQVDR